MDQASIGAQLPNGLGPLGTRTPLGEPISHFSASFLAEDPLAWHMHYWLSLEVVGVMRGEDAMLMALRVEWEQELLLGDGIKIQLLTDNVWPRYRILNRERYEQFWAQMTVESEDARWYLRDVDRMLVDKARKTRAKLRRSERMMQAALQAVSIDIEELTQQYGKLQEEETAEAEARNRLSNRAGGAHNQEG